MTRHVVLVGGGTAGHVYPALAIAEVYPQVVPSVELLFVGTGDGFETRLVPRSGYPLRVVRSSPIYGRNLVGKARTLGGLGGAILRARRMLQESRADIVLGFGGYASVPTLLAARLLGLPTAIHECNAVAGLANRLLGRFVDRVYLGFESAAREFKPGQTLLTGIPVRPDVGAFTGQTHLPPSGGRPFHILVTGGSQGSSFLNDHVPQLLAGLGGAGVAVEVLHQSGPNDAQATIERYRQVRVAATVSPFIEDMADAYRWSDIAIACSGAVTLAEVASVGLPVILVPLSSSASNHQVPNARAFESITGSFWISEQDWTNSVLMNQTHALLSDQTAWRAASEGVRRFAKPDASQMLVADCEKIIKIRRRMGTKLHKA